MLTLEVEDRVQQEIIINIINTLLFLKDNSKLLAEVSSRHIILSLAQ